MIKFNDAQIEAENILRSIDGISEEKIEEIMGMFKDIEDEKANPSILKAKDETEQLLKLQLQKEPDWRIRAGIAAMLISKSLD